MDSKLESTCRVSFVIAARNASNYIRECIDSLLNQTYQNIEVIVCDDGSTDDTVDQLSVFMDDPRFTLLQNDKPMRAAQARNRCVDVACGEFIAIQDADDRSMLERAKLQVDFLRKNPSVAMVGGQAALFDETGTWGYSQKPTVPTEADLMFALPFVHASLMIRAEVLRSVQGYRVARETRRGQDYDLVLRMYAQGHRGQNLPDVVYQYRVDHDAISRRKYTYRLSEAVVRAKGFSANGFGVRAVPYIIKPLVVGLLPPPIMHWLRKRGLGVRRA